MAPTRRHQPSAPERRSDVRGHILETAFGLLADHGVGYLTQPRVSKAAGVRQSHLTYYFPTRADLLAGVARHSMEVLAGPLINQAQRGALSAEQLPVILTGALTDRRRIRAMLGLVVTADEDPNVRETLRELLALVRQRLGEMFGPLGLPNDPRSLALLHTFVVGAAVLNHAQANDNGAREAEQAARFITQLLPSLAQQPDRPSDSRPTAGDRS